MPRDPHHHFRFADFDLGEKIGRGREGRSPGGAVVGPPIHSGRFGPAVTRAVKVGAKVSLPRDPEEFHSTSRI